MGNNVYKTIEITGSSTSSVEDAVTGAIAKASETVRNLDWFEVTDIRGHFTGDTIGHVQVTMKVGFRLDDDE